MRVTTITYERTFNKGNFESEKIGIEIALDRQDNAANAMQRAKAFVEGNRS